MYRPTCCDNSCTGLRLISRRCTGQFRASKKAPRFHATPRHRFHDTRLWVDIDLTPLPIGAKAEGSERTWMGRNRSKTGRKTLRILPIPPMRR